ncbi:MAG: hypothetical protein JOZ19_13770 [Rubrobacter sp.]|nr:hypothetical protein [Rubrobacter sp.]
MPWLDSIAEKVQPVAQKAVDKDGVTLRDALDGTWLGTLLHPALSDGTYFIGSWTAALVFDGLDAVTNSRVMRNAVDAALAVGVIGSFAAAVAGISGWRYLRGGSRRMGLAHALVNAAGLDLNAVGAHLGGELSYGYALRVNSKAFEKGGPDEFTPVLEESELPNSGMRSVEAGGMQILLSRAVVRSASSSTFAALSQGLQPFRRTALRRRPRRCHRRLPLMQVTLRLMRRRGDRRPGRLSPAALRDEGARGDHRGQSRRRKRLEKSGKPALL